MTENILGITDPAKLSDAEERLSKKRAKELFDSGDLFKLNGSVAGLKAIHRALFMDVYDFAGEIRKVDIAKGSTRFTPVFVLPTSLEFIDIMPQDSFEDVVDKYIETNIAHPFRAGNGRSLRIWLNLMLQKTVGKVVDFSKIDKTAYRAAMKVCSVDDEALYKQLESALTSDCGRDTYLRSLDASYLFEGFGLYKAAEL